MGGPYRFAKRALGTLLAIVALSGAAAADISASGVTFSASPERTRFALELSGEPAPRIFVVDQPPRLVVDLDGVDFDLDGPVDPSGLVGDWRYGPLRKGTGRIVFDLAEPALVARQFFLPPLAGRPGRLVLDLERVSPRRFAAAAHSAVARIEDDVTPAPHDARAVVVLDPGHGGIDPGATSSVDGVFEKDLVLGFAQRLAGELEKIPGLAVYLTRSDDTFLSLARRIRVARAYGADLFISLHADAAPQDFVSGASVYTLSERPSDAEAAALAARENLSDAVSGVVEPEVKEDVSDILADLMRRETKTFSLEFAETLVTRLGEAVQMNNNPHRYARFRVLMAHDFPSVLIELGYLTNADDAHTLADPNWQDRAARALSASVARFFDLPSAGTSTAQGTGTAATLPLR